MHISLSDLRSQAERLAAILSTAQREQEPDERYRTFLDEHSRLLLDALRDAETPETYRVAVVGSFKVGKSSFVNALCDVTRLVSVAANPETAAVTTLRYSEQAYARIHMITRGEWQAMRDAYSVDPSDPAAVRYAAMLKKEKSGDLLLPGKDGKEKIRTTIAALEGRFLTDEGKVEPVACADWSNQKAQLEFGRHMSAFTSQSSPAHFFVDRLEVFVPVPFLRSGIELIDTPGLDDPDRYRVRITEKLVEDVDVILFLTQSGRAYSQQDKDFITTQLRKGKLKHLMVIVTRCDETYGNACRDAEEVGDEPPTFAEHLAREEERLRTQIRNTLDELLSDPKLREDLGMFYLDKLLDIKVNFTSAHDYAEARKEKDPAKARELLDRSGLVQLRTDLGEMLARSERIVRAKRTLADAIERVADRTIRAFTARRDSVSSEFNIERVRTQLAQIDAALTERLTGFAASIGEQVRLLREQNAISQVLTNAYMNTAVLQAREVVTREFEMSDMARHWKTRRNGGWGSLYDIQNKIANRIFPQVEQTLRSYTTRFAQLLERTRADLERLEATLSEIEATNGLGGDIQTLDLTRVFDQSYQQKLLELENLVELQRDGIISHLDAFVSAEVEEKIDEARAHVANEWGRGTTIRQNDHVSEFYRLLHHELQQALQIYLRDSATTFVGVLEHNADLIYPDLKHDLDQTIEDHRKAIESNLSERNEHQKVELVKYLRRILNELEHFQSKVSVTA